MKICRKDYLQDNVSDAHRLMRSMHTHIFYHLPVNLYSFVLPALLVNIQWSLAQHQKLKFDDTGSFKRREKQTHYLDNFSLTAPLKFPAWPSHDLHSCLIWYGIFLLPEEWSVTVREDSWEQESHHLKSRRRGKKNIAWMEQRFIFSISWQIFTENFLCCLRTSTLTSTNFLWQITRKYFSEKENGSSTFQVPL